MPRIQKTPPVDIRCPFCNAQGVNQVEAKLIGFFAIIYCKQCGAIHGAVPKPQDAKITIKSEPTEVQNEPPKFRKPVPLPDEPEPKPAQPLTPDRAQAMMKHYVQPGSTMYKTIRKDDDT